MYMYTCSLCTHAYRLNRNDITKYHPDLKFFLTVIFSVAMVTWWVLERNER